MLHFICRLLIVLASISTGHSRAVFGDSCASLQKNGQYVIDSHLVRAEGLAHISRVTAQNVTDVNLSTFCRVIGRIPYGPNNTLNFEVWLPDTESYNERYISVGELVGVVRWLEEDSKLTHWRKWRLCRYGRLSGNDHKPEQWLRCGRVRFH